MKIVCLSDTHRLHRTIEVALEGDLLIHCGDFTFFCEEPHVLKDFNDWLGELRFRNRVVIPGNHERCMFERPELRRMISNAMLLVNEAVTVEGVRLWGSPVTCDDAAWGCTTAEERRAVYDTIPEGTNIVISHGPPYGVRDVEFRGGGIHRGCPELLAAIQRVAPQVVIFGHVHAGRGAVRIGPTTFINAAMMGWSGELENRPIAFDFPLVKKEEAI